MKIFAALCDDAHQGWVWLKNPSLPRRSIVKITNPTSKKVIYCEALQIEENFLKNYNQGPRCHITEPESSLVIGFWYRDALEIDKTQQDFPLDVEPCNTYWGRYKACEYHPQIVIRVAIKLGVISVLLGLISIGLGLIALF